MTIIIFLIILSALIIVHELGHFFAAKYFKIRIDEFGLGLPPKAKHLFSWKGTDFTLNWLPFGGFVKIFGENPETGAGTSNPRALPTSGGLRRDSNLEVPAPTPVPKDSFQAKSRDKQAVVLAGGVVGNLLFAWILLSLGLMIGLPAPVALDLPVENVRTVITAVLPGSPAEEVGLKSGDAIPGFSPEEISQTIAESPSGVTLHIERGGESLLSDVAPREGVVDDRVAIGISMDLIGTVKLSFGRALIEGARFTYMLTIVTAQALASFIISAFTGTADLATVAGPVGLVGLVGDATALGLAYLLSFTAIISINLAIINLVPFPALDGGRLLFVAIEALMRRPIPPRVTNTINTVGFALLIFLMILITIRDVRNIF